MQLDIGTLISINNAQSLVNNRDSTSIKDLTNGATLRVRYHRHSRGSAFIR